MLPLRRQTISSVGCRCEPDIKGFWLMICGVGVQVIGSGPVVEYFEYQSITFLGCAHATNWLVNSRCFRHHLHRPKRDANQSIAWFPCTNFSSPPGKPVMPCLPSARGTLRSLKLFSGSPRN